MLSDLARTIHTCHIPRGPFDALIAANRQDQFVHRYGTYADLLDYCELSANPVGQLVLYVFGAADARTGSRCRTRCAPRCRSWSTARTSPRTSTGAGSTCRARTWIGSVSPMPTSRHRAATTQVRALLAFQTQRAMRLLEDGVPLVGSLRGWARLAISGYLAGGFATAKAIADADYDVLTGTPKPTTSTRCATGCRCSPAGGCNPITCDEGNRPMDVAPPTSGASRSPPSRHATSPTGSSCCRRRSAARCPRCTRSPAGSTTSATATQPAAERLAGLAGVRDAVEPAGRARAGTRCWSRSPTPRCAPACRFPRSTT